MSPPYTRQISPPVAIPSSPRKNNSHQESMEESVQLTVGPPPSKNKTPIDYTQYTNDWKNDIPSLFFQDKKIISADKKPNSKAPMNFFQPANPKPSLFNSEESLQAHEHMQLISFSNAQLNRVKRRLTKCPSQILSSEFTKHEDFFGAWIPDSKHPIDRIEDRMKGIKEAISNLEKNISTLTTWFCNNIDPSLFPTKNNNDIKNDFIYKLLADIHLALTTHERVEEWLDNQGANFLPSRDILGEKFTKLINIKLRLRDYKKEQYRLNNVLKELVEEFKSELEKEPKLENQKIITRQGRKLGH